MAGGKGEGASAASAVCGGGGSGDSRWSHAGPAKRRRRSRARQRSRPLHRPCCFDSHKSTAAGASAHSRGRTGKGGGGRGPRQARGCASASRPRGGGASLHDSLPPPPTLSPPTLSALPLPPSLSRPHASGSVAPRARDSAPRERLLLHQAVGAERPSTTRSLALRRRHGMGREGSGGGAETVEAASRRSVAKQNKVWVAQPRLRLSRQGLPPQAI